MLCRRSSLNNHTLPFLSIHRDGTEGNNQSQSPGRAPIHDRVRKISICRRKQHFIALRGLAAGWVECITVMSFASPFFRLLIESFGGHYRFIFYTLHCTEPHDNHPSLFICRSVIVIGLSVQQRVSIWNLSSTAVLVDILQTQSAIYVPPGMLFQSDTSSNLFAIKKGCTPNLSAIHGPIDRQLRVVWPV